MMRVLGINLAWATNKSRVSNEIGVVAVEDDGTVVDAGWTRGLVETLDWIEANAGLEAFAMIDTPLVVTNLVRQRPARSRRASGTADGRCRRTAPISTHQISVARSCSSCSRSVDGATAPAGTGPPAAGRHFSECYPYTTMVGAGELRYDDERPVYTGIRRESQRQRSSASGGRLRRAHRPSGFLPKPTRRFG